MPQLFSHAPAFRFEVRCQHGKTDWSRYAVSMVKRIGSCSLSMIGAIGFAMCGLASIPTTAGPLMDWCTSETPMPIRTSGRATNATRMAPIGGCLHSHPASISSGERLRDHDNRPRAILPGWLRRSPISTSLLDLSKKKVRIFEQRFVTRSVDWRRKSTLASPALIASLVKSTRN